MFFEMFEDEQNNYNNYFNNTFLDDSLYDSNNSLIQGLHHYVLGSKNYSMGDIDICIDNHINEDEQYKENKIYYNENKLDQVTKITEIGTDAKTGENTINAKIKDNLIFKITKEKKNNFVGNKRKRTNGGKHNKFCYDNVTRKFKTKFFESLLSYLNSSTEKIEIENTKKFSKKKVYSKPIFLKINQEIIKNINVDFNQKLLKSTIKEIFSNNISTKMQNYRPDHNEKEIKKIIKENFQKKTIGILDRTLLECLEHFRGTKHYKELEGLENQYKIVIENMKENETDEYIQLFEDFVNRFEEYYGNKKARPKKIIKKKTNFNC